jgi:hypothetical protein
MKNLLPILAAAALFAAAFSAASAQMPLSAKQSMEAIAPGGSLPPGHPAMGAMPDVDPADMPKLTGTLTVQVVPGTAGGTVSPSDPVTVTFKHRGTRISSVDGKLDSAGKVTFADVSVMPPVDPTITITHAGIPQSFAAAQMNPNQPDQTVAMKVYEPGDAKPEWNITMEHVIVQWAEDGSGVRVVQMLSVNTAGDHIWQGEKVGEKRLTMTIPIPPGTAQMELGGSFDQDASYIANDKVLTGGPLFPGNTKYTLTYTVPAKDGKLELPITTAATVANLIVFLPADDVQVSATGLTGGTPVDKGEGPVRMYTAQNLDLGAKVALAISGITPQLVESEGAGDGETPVKAASGLSARSIALGGAFLIALIGAGMIVVKKSGAKKDASTQESA